MNRGLLLGMAMLALLAVGGCANVDQYSIWHAERKWSARQESRDGSGLFVRWNRQISESRGDSATDGAVLTNAERKFSYNQRESMRRLSVAELNHKNSTDADGKIVMSESAVGNAARKLSEAQGRRQ